MIVQKKINDYDQSELLPLWITHSDTLANSPDLSFTYVKNTDTTNHPTYFSEIMEWAKKKNPIYANTIKIQQTFYM